MFSLLYVNQVNTPLAIRVESPAGDSAELSIGPMITKRDKEELSPEHQFALLNSYLDYKGDKFKTLLFKRIYDADLAVQEAGFKLGITDLPTNEVHVILDMFDMTDVVTYVRDIYRVTPPVNLQPEFDQRIETDKLGTRVQTYIQQDYYELAALTIPIKAVIGVLGQYAIRKESCISQIHKEYVLYSMISDHKLMSYQAVVKLKAWANILINQTIQTTDAMSVTVIEKRIPMSELPSYLLAAVIMQKLSVAVIVQDTKERNIITRVYNYIGNRLKTRAGIGTKIREKKPLSDADSTSGDKESVVESYRIVSSITSGIEEELCWYTENMEWLIRDMDVSVNKAVLNDILQHSQCFREIALTRDQVTIAGYVFKRILDPRAMEFISIDGLINIISLGTLLLWTNGHREIALLLNAKPIISNDDDVDINSTPNVRLIPELKERMSIIYPYEKRLNVNKTESIVENAITEVTYNVFRNRWLPNLPKQLLDEHFGDKPVRVLSPEFKNNLARLIINIGEIDATNTGK